MVSKNSPDISDSDDFLQKNIRVKIRLGGCVATIN